ncbi:MAG: permease prefix domain 1-containing protein [Pseudolysinimonas sp.]
MTELDTRIAEWRAAVSRGPAVAASDADELETHLRDQIAELETAGLTGDEAFLIAVKRLGSADALTAEFAREHGDRLWKQLVATSSAPASGSPSRDIVTMLVFAVIAGGLLQGARLLSGIPGGDTTWLPRNASLIVLTVLAAYLAWTHRIGIRIAVVLGAVVAVIAVLINVLPSLQPVATGSALIAGQQLVVLHLPVVLWFIVGIAYLGTQWRSSARRMDFVRFSGEWAIYLVLIALGGAVLVGLTTLVLLPIAGEAVVPMQEWVVPTGIGGAVIVGAWLVESKKSVIENIAPVLTAIFTPLFALMLVVSAVGYLIAGIGHEFNRDLLTVFDVLLLVVLALVLYGLSARDPLRPAGLMDVIRLVAVVAAIILDALVLGSMFARIGEFGFTANRVAALGLNLLLVIDLVVTAALTIGMLARRIPAARLERFQTSALPVFGVWALVVVFVLPPLFG